MTKAQFIAAATKEFRDIDPFFLRPSRSLARMVNEISRHLSALEMFARIINANSEHSKAADAEVQRFHEFLKTNNLSHLLEQ